MREDLQKKQEMEAPSVFPVHQDQEFVKNGVSNGISNGVSKNCDNGVSKNCDNGVSKVHNRRPVQHAMPSQEQDDSSDSTESTALESMPTRGQLFMDPANMCTLVGAMLSSLAMAAMWRKSYDIGMLLNMGANIADILDGPIARNLPKRRPIFSAIGSKLDTYSDMVSHFVVPASLLMHMSGLDILYVGLATIWVVTGIVRQSYFEVIERCDGGSCIFGVTSDYMPPLFALALHLLPICGQEGQANWVLPALGVCTLFMIYGSLTFSLKSRRYGGFGLFTVTLYNISLCVSMAIMWARGSFSDTSPLGLWSFESLSLLLHLLLAYPCYFRFVELNLNSP